MNIGAPVLRPCVRSMGRKGSGTRGGYVWEFPCSKSEEQYPVRCRTVVRLSCAVWAAFLGRTLYAVGIDHPDSPAGPCKARPASRIIIGMQDAGQTLRLPVDDGVVGSLARMWSDHGIHTVCTAQPTLRSTNPNNHENIVHIGRSARLRAFRHLHFGSASTTSLAFQRKDERRTTGAHQQQYRFGARRTYA